MTTRIVSVFNTQDQAQQALQALTAHGIPQDTISAIIPSGDQLESTQPNAAEAGGAAIGSGALATLGLVSLAVIGIGPLLAVGPFAAALGVAASANAKHANALDQIAQALQNSGLTESQASAYAQSVGEGNSLIALDIPDDQVGAIADLLHANGGTGLDYRPIE